MNEINDIVLLLQYYHFAPAQLNIYWWMCIYEDDTAHCAHSQTSSMPDD